MEVQPPDYGGMNAWADSYPNDRLSEIKARQDSRTGGTITLKSGEYPAFTRFVKDVRAALHENGFVISRAWNNKAAYGNESLETVHVINAIPLLWVVAYADGMVCKRGACRHIRQPTRPYCEDCGGGRVHEPYDKDDIVMINA